MGTKEIHSPAPAGPAATPGKGQDLMSQSFGRKKLSLYFMESDDRMTAFSRGYTGGTTPVNLRGKPISDLSKTGGWIAALFIFGKQSSRVGKKLEVVSVDSCSVGYFLG